MSQLKGTPFELDNRRFVCIFNPIAGKNSTKRAFKKVISSVCEVPNSEVFIARDGEFPVVRENDVLGICGGDGTLHITLTNLLNRDENANLPYILHLRGGSMNTVASSVGLKDSVDTIIKKFLAGEGSVVRKRALQIYNNKTKQYGFIFGLGLFTNFLDFYYSDLSVMNAKLKLSGPPKALITLMTAISDAFRNKIDRFFRKVALNVIVDGERVKFDEFVAIGISTVRSLGLNFNAFFRADSSQDKFHTVLLDANPLEIFLNLPSLYKGKVLPFGKEFEKLSQKVVIESKSEIKYTIDGDIYSSDFIEVTRGPLVNLIIF